MPGAGPVLVVTDVGELRPDAHSCMLVFTAVHPGVTADDVRARTGWDLAVTRDLEVTEPPSPEEIAALRGLEATRGLHG